MSRHHRSAGEVSRPFTLPGLLVPVALVAACAAFGTPGRAVEPPPPQPPAAVAPADAPVAAPEAAPATPAAAPAAASLPGPKPGQNDRQIAVAVRRHLEGEHFLRRRIDDAMAGRWFENFLESLDPMKVYFLQSDVDAFAQKRDQLDDLVKKGNVAFAYEVFDRFLKRVDSRQPLIERLIAEQHDFTKDETVVVDRKATTWAKTEADAEDLWRRRIKWDLLVQKMEETPPEEVKEKLLRRYRGFARRMHQMTSDQLLELYLTSLTNSFDPHSTFMSPGSKEEFQIQMKTELDGIGAQLRAEDGTTTIEVLTPGGAAERDGRLKAKDRIVGVGQGADGEIVETAEMSLNEVVKLIRGKRGTLVRLKVIPAGQKVPVVYDITRDKIELKEARARGEVLEHGQKPDGTPWRIGFINLPSFYMDIEAAQRGQADFNSSARDVRRLLDEFRDKKVDCVMIDLRANGGGSLPEVIDLTGLFIDRGPVVQVKDADSQVRPYDDVVAGTAWDGPLVLLTSKFSASASEILAGAIQDYRRGLVIGDEATHGKGTVQSVVDLGQQLFQRFDNAPALGAIKLTMQQFYRPSGGSTQLEGVKSDVVLPSLTTHLPVGEGDLDHALPHDQVPPAAYKTLGLVSDAIIEQLRARSVERVRDDAEFAKLGEDVARYKRRKDEKTVSLVETEFARQWNEGKAAEDEEEKKLEEMESAKRPVVKRDYYLDEALDVTTDYLRMLKGQSLPPVVAQRSAEATDATAAAATPATPALP